MDINTTPLVDVMLVLLIIFLITIPVVTSSVKVELPKESNQVRQTQPENVIISIDEGGHIFLYDTPVPDTKELMARLKVFAEHQPQPEVQIRGDGSSDFEAVGRVIHALQRSGMAKVAFITEPSF